MAKEALIKIKEAENAAAEIIRLAAEKADSIAKEAEAAAFAQRDSTIKAAIRQKQKISENAAEEAKTICAPIVASGDAEIEKILAPAPERFKRAVDTVLERILNLQWQ